MADEQGANRWEHWINFGASIVAPLTVLSAVLYYFGYVTARAEYGYFGVDVDTIGLSTREYVQRSPQALLVPLLTLTFAGIGVLLMHTAVRRRVNQVLTGDSTEDERRLRHGCAAGRWLGLSLLSGGVVLLLLYPVVPAVRDWDPFNLLTPLLIAIGASSALYVQRVLRMITPRSQSSAAGHTGTLVLQRSTGMLVTVLIVASLFWATATVAQWTGRGIARYNAQHLDRLPTVILDTEQRLYSTAGCRHDRSRPAAEDHCVLEQALPMAPGQTYRYRYRNLRLLIQGGDRMFLVPDVWDASDATLVVPLDGSVRVRFLFENDPP